MVYRGGDDVGVEVDVGWGSPQCGHIGMSVYVWVCGVWW